MDNVTAGRLPAPHDCIEIRVEEWPNGFDVEYFARPPELRGAGLVTPYMEGKIVRQRSGMQLDEQRRRFRLFAIDRFPNPPKRLLWESGERIRLRYYGVCRNVVLSLPGVRALYPNGLPTQEERDEAIRRNPAPGDRVCGSLSARACAYADQVGRVVSRERGIGRLQRLMRWHLIDGTVIAPDWAWLVRERLAGGAR